MARYRWRWLWRQSEMHSLMIQQNTQILTGDGIGNNADDDDDGDGIDDESDNDNDDDGVSDDYDVFPYDPTEC